MAGTLPSATMTIPSGAAAASHPPSYGRVSLSMLANQTHVNLLGNVHGGEVMRLVDSTAGAVAQRHSGGPAVTAAMDEMAFLQPVHVGDILRATAQVNWAGRTSMEIGVRVESEPWNEAGHATRCTSRRRTSSSSPSTRTADPRDDPGARAGDPRGASAAPTRPRSAAPTASPARPRSTPPAAPGEADPTLRR